MTQTKYSISAASRITGVSRPTLLRHAKQGRFSYELNDEGHKLVTAAELIRAYGNDLDFQSEENRGQRKKTTRSEKEPKESGAAIKELQDQLIKRYTDENEHLKEVLHKALDHQNSFQKLLEDRTSEQNQWKKLLDSKIADMEQRHVQEIRKLRHALYNERNKTLWEKLFGTSRQRTTGKQQ